MLLAFFVENLVMFALAYIEALNIGLGTRDILFIHYGVCGFPFGIVLIAWNEFRKLCVNIII